MSLPQHPLSHLGSLRGTRGPAILELLAAEGKPVQRSEIRRRLELGEAQLSHLLRDLEQADLVRRHKPGKGREILVELGPVGREVVESEILPVWVERLLREVDSLRRGRPTPPSLLAAELAEAGAPSVLAAQRLARAFSTLSFPSLAQDLHEIPDPDARTIMVDLGQTQKEELEELAARKGGAEGMSSLIQEAIDLYLDRHRERAARVREALSVLGTLDEAAANEMEETVRQLRSSWR